MDYTKYEKVRIIGARALQIAMGAPILTERGDELNPIKIARKEFDENVLPISVKRIPPKKVVESKKGEVIEPEAEVEAEAAGDDNTSAEA